MVGSAFLASLAIISAGAAQAAVLQGGWITEADYPASAKAAGEQGAARVRFLISTGGSVSECNVVQSSGSPALDSRTCELLLQRFRFAAARDASGKPVEEWRTQKISWKLPADAAASTAYATARLKTDVKVDVAKDGGIESCEVIKQSGDPKFDAVACLYLTRRGKLTPRTNEKGRPIRSVQIVPVWQ